MIEWGAKRATRRVLWFAALSLLFVACSDGALLLKGNYPADGGLPGDGPGTPASPGPSSIEGDGLALRIDAPLAGDLIDRPVIAIAGTVEGADTVRINGEVVTATGGSFAHNLRVMAEGPVEVIAEVAGLPPLRVPVTVDLTPPIINITQPPRGAFLREGQDDTLEVIGTARDAATSVTEVTVNGQVVSVGRDGSFTASLTPQPGTNFVKVTATDAVGAQSATTRAALYGQYEDWARPTDDSINLRLRADGLQMLGQNLGQSLAGQLLDDFQTQDSDEVEVRGISFSRLEVDLVPAQGYVDTRISIFELVVEVAVTQRLLFFDVTITGDVSTNPAVLTGDLYLNPDGAGGLSARFENADVRLRDFDLDLDGLASILEGLVEGFVEDLAVDLLTDVLNDGLLGNLVEAGGITTSFDLFGQEASLNFLITQTDIDPQGVTIGLDAAVDAPVSPLIPPSPGRFATPSAPPQTPNPERMLRLSLSDDFVNQLLGVVWRSGGLNLNVADLIGEDGGSPVDLTVGTFSLLAGDGLLDYGERDTPVGLNIRPLLPPVASVQSADQGILGLALGDFMLDFTVESEGGSQLWATVATQLIINLILDFDEAGELVVETELIVDADLDAEPLFDIDDATFEQFIATLLTSLPDLLGDDLLSGLGEDSENDDLGLGLDNVSLRPDGAGKDYLSIYLDFIQQF